MEDEAIAQQIVDAALKVHQALGPGLLESAYQACYAYELRQRGLNVEQEVAYPVVYAGQKLETGYRADLLVEQRILVEHKAVEQLLPIHEAQLLTYLKLSGLSLGFLIDWNVRLLKNGLRRVVLNHPTRPLAYSNSEVNREGTKGRRKP